jgi:hypothetical protein
VAARYRKREIMSETYVGRPARGAIRRESGNAAPLGAARAREPPARAPLVPALDWLCLAAAPTFAIMALLTGILGGSPTDMLCATAQDASPLSGMATMYVLMSAFHSAPWLKLIFGRRS